MNSDFQVLYKTTMVQFILQIRIWEATYLEINISRRTPETRMTFSIQVWEAQEAFKEPQG